MRRREKERDARDRRRRGGRREGEGTVGGGRILAERWGMSRRVVCSHGSSLGTAVQYAGQGKVTLLCVRARSRECAPRSAHYHSHTPLLTHSQSARTRPVYILPSSSLSSWLYHSLTEIEKKGDCERGAEEGEGGDGVEKDEFWKNEERNTQWSRRRRR